MLVYHRAVMMTKRVKTSLVVSRRISKSLSRWLAWASLRLDFEVTQEVQCFLLSGSLSGCRIPNAIQAKVCSVISDHVRKVLLFSRSYLSTSELEGATLFVR